MDAAHNIAPLASLAPAGLSGDVVASVWRVACPGGAPPFGIDGPSFARACRGIAMAQAGAAVSESSFLAMQNMALPPPAVAMHARASAPAPALAPAPAPAALPFHHPVSSEADDEFGGFAAAPLPATAKPAAPADAFLAALASGLSASALAADAATLRAATERRAQPLAARAAAAGLAAALPAAPASRSRGGSGALLSAFDELMPAAVPPPVTAPVAPPVALAAGTKDEDDDFAAFSAAPVPASAPVALPAASLVDASGRAGGDGFTAFSSPASPDSAVPARSVGGGEPASGHGSGIVLKRSFAGVAAAVSPPARSGFSLLAAAAAAEATDRKSVV